MSVLLRTAARTAIRAAPAARPMSRALPTAQLFGARAFATMYYTESHEFVKVDGATGTIGITSFAAEALGDVVYCELPDVGSSFDKGESFGSVESVKAASDVYVPVGGEVMEINENLSENPALVNQSAVEDGWFIKLKIADAAELEGLMDDAAYAAF